MTDNKAIAATLAAALIQSTHVHVSSGDPVEDAVTLYFRCLDELERASKKRPTGKTTNQPLGI